MLKRKIYSSFAFQKDEKEKVAINREIHDELRCKHKVFRHDSKLNLVDGKDCNFADYDVVIGRDAQHHRAEYRIHKNSPNLSTDELALLCDRSLWFGYYQEANGHIVVFED